MNNKLAMSKVSRCIAVATTGVALVVGASVMSFYGYAYEKTLDPFGLIEKELANGEAEVSNPDYELQLEEAGEQQYEEYYAANPDAERIDFMPKKVTSDQLAVSDGIPGVQEYVPGKSEQKERMEKARAEFDSGNALEPNIKASQVPKVNQATFPSFSSQMKTGINRSLLSISTASPTESLFTPAYAASPTLKTSGQLVSYNRAVGDLYLYGNMTQLNAGTYTKIGNGWSYFDSIHVTDWDGNGTGDIVAYKASNGELRVYRGATDGGFSSPLLLGKMQTNARIAVGDAGFGSNYPGIFFIATNGTLQYYPRSSSTALNKTGVVLADGFNVQDQLVTQNLSSGSSAVTTDILRKTTDGKIYRYISNTNKYYIQEGTSIGTLGKAKTRIFGAKNFAGSGKNGFIEIDHTKTAKVGTISYYDFTDFRTISKPSANIGASSYWAEAKPINGSHWNPQ